MTDTYRLVWDRLQRITDDGTPATQTITTGDLATMRAQWDRLIGENRGYADMRDMERWATIPGHFNHTNGVRYALHLIGAGTARVELV